MASCVADDVQGRWEKNSNAGRWWGCQHATIKTEENIPCHVTLSDLIMMASLAWFGNNFEEFATLFQRNLQSESLWEITRRSWQVRFSEATQHYCIRARRSVVTLASCINTCTAVIDHCPRTAVVDGSQLRFTHNSRAQPLLLNASIALWMALILLPGIRTQIITVPKVHPPPL